MDLPPYSLPSHPSLVGNDTAKPCEKLSIKLLFNKTPLVINYGRNDIHGRDILIKIKYLELLDKRKALQQQVSNLGALRNTPLHYVFKYNLCEKEREIKDLDWAIQILQIFIDASSGLAQVNMAPNYLESLDNDYSESDLNAPGESQFPNDCQPAFGNQSSDFFSVSSSSVLSDTSRPKELPAPKRHDSFINLYKKESWNIR